MRTKIVYSFLAVICSFLLFSCGGQEKQDDRIAEGVITYAAEPVDPASSMADFAPTKMVVKFKKNKTCAEMVAGMGALSLAFIADSETKTLMQRVRFFTSKYLVAQDENELKKNNELFNIEIIPTNQTKVIAGYNCKMARVHYKGGDPNDFDIYYTNDIHLDNSNFSNPYFSVEGVLMEYRIKKYGLELQFTATSVVKQEIDESAFEITEDYEKITEKELSTKLLGTLGASI